MRGSYGRSIRAADYTERFVSYNIEQLSPGRNAGNPDLQAEVSNTMDFGIDLFLRNGFNLNSTFFIRQSEDLIDFSLRNADDITNLSNLVAGEDYFYADNISQSQVIGFECKLQKSIISGQDLNIDAQLGYTFLETSSDAGLLSKYISNHPKNNVNATIWIGYKSIKLSANAIYISRQGETSETVSAEIPEDYFIANARLSLDLIDGFSVYGQVSNFTDTKYEEILGAKLPGRWMALGIKWWIHNK